MNLLPRFDERGRCRARILIGSMCMLAVCFGRLDGADEESASGSTGEIVDLTPFDVTASTSDQEYWPEEAADMFPFRRSGMFASLLADEEANREDFADLSEQLGALGDFQPIEFVMASGAGAPRGFTTPRLRNGITQTGFPEIIVSGKRDLLTGFLATYYGRTAPGGILNHVSQRPSPKPKHLASFRGSSLGEISASGERHAPLVPKRLHYRATASVQWKTGPQDYARQLSSTAGFTLRYSPRKASVWLVELEGSSIDGRPAASIPLVRATSGARKGGPYLPLATFNTNGPNTWSRRRSGSLSALFEHEIKPGLTFRGGGEVWAREQKELRFNTGAYLLDERVFDGVREPQYNGRDQWATGLQFELDGIGRLPWIDHRWVAGVYYSRDRAAREQRALPKTVRNALPERVRVFDPDDPDYSIVPYSSETYSRVLALRDEGSDNEGAFFTERFTLANERVNATVGVRVDRVDAFVDDERSDATTPHAENTNDKASFHVGAVSHVVPNRLAAFLNYSTAFQPERRVDTRTGKIIGNESTAGVETGLRYSTPNGKSSLTWTAYRLWNENITRTNPRYNDPVLDPDQREPQYVSSGEERFTGTEFGFRHRPSDGLTLSGKASWLDAITTSSPDLPQEVGRQLSRLPRFSAAGSVDYRFAAERLGGLRLGASYSWVGHHVAVYEDTKYEQVEYGGYGVLGLRGSVGWKVRRSLQQLSLNVRNILDRDLVEDAGRLGGERAVDATLNVQF